MLVDHHLIISQNSSEFLLCSTTGERIVIKMREEQGRQKKVWRGEKWILNIGLLAEKQPELAKKLIHNCSYYVHETIKINAATDFNYLKISVEERGSDPISTIHICWREGDDGKYISHV